MTDVHAVPPGEDRGVQTPSSTAGHATVPPARNPAGTSAAATTICLLGALLTGLCLVTADRLDRSGPARSLAVVAVVTALVAVLVAVGGQLSALLVRPQAGRDVGRRGALMVMVAGVLSLLAVLLAGAAALIVVQPRDTVAAIEPTMVVQRSTTGPLPTVTAHLSFPGLTAGSVIDATMSEINEDTAPSVLARSAVRVGEDGPAALQMAAPADPNGDVVIEARAPGRTCTVRLPAAGSADPAGARLTCTTS